MHGTPEVLHESPKVELTLLGAGCHDAPQGRDFPPHQHTNWEIVYYRVGNILCPLGSETYESRPGMLLVTPPDTLHAEIARTAYRNYFINVAAPPEMPWARVCFDDTDGSLEAVCRALVREYSRQDAQRGVMTQLLLHQLDILLRRARSAPPSEGEAVVLAAESVIQSRFAAPITVQEIAREIGVSPSCLRARFAAQRGSSPLACLHTVRANHAVAMLQNSSLTLEAVAALCGYDSASHLSRRVKQATGSRPGALRRRQT